MFQFQLEFLIQIYCGLLVVSSPPLPLPLPRAYASVALGLSLIYSFKMPCLRGIEVSLTTKPDDEPIPEYPHPEGASARILSSAHTAQVLPSCARDRSGLLNGPILHRKAGPVVSVYIPSIPGRSSAVMGCSHGAWDSN